MGSSNLRTRLLAHAEKVAQAEKMETALSGVLDQRAHAARKQFETHVAEVIKPAFDDFKITLREIGKDAEILIRLSHDIKQSITLVMMERYLSFGSGKTIKLVNPKEDVTERKRTKFYEVYSTNGFLFVRQRWDEHIEPITTQVGYEDVGTQFLENELAAFFERVYPTTANV